MNNIEDEDERTRRAVNKAACETEPDDDEPIADGGLPPDAPLMPVGPDLKVFISADGVKGRYCYRLVDANAGLSHCCVRPLPSANRTALALLAICDSLKSVLKRRIVDVLMERYGYSTRSAALSSHRRLRVELVVTDPALAELGEIITSPSNEDALPFLPMHESDRRIWQVVLEQIRRFDVTWRHIDPNALILTRLESWADMVLARAKHDGVVQSFQRSFTLPIEDAA
jgi:hypothetical protein